MQIERQRAKGHGGHPGLLLSFQACAQCGWSSSTVGTSQPCPPHRGTSVKASHVTAERSNKTPGTWENRHRERQQQVTGEQVQSGTDWTPLWLKRACSTCKMPSTNTCCALYQPIWNGLSDPSTTISDSQDPQHLKAKCSSKPKKVLSWRDLSTSTWIGCHEILLLECLM